MVFVTNIVQSQVQTVSDKDRLVSVKQKSCEMTGGGVYVEHSFGNSLIGGIISGLIGKQIRGGPGKEIAKLLGAIVGTNMGRNHSENTVNLQMREICRDIMREIKRGKLNTLRIDGSLHTVVTDD